MILEKLFFIKTLFLLLAKEGKLGLQGVKCPLESISASKPFDSTALCPASSCFQKREVVKND